MLRYADAIVKRGVDKLIDAIGHTPEPQTKNTEKPQPQKSKSNDTDCAPQTTDSTTNCGLTEHAISLMDELCDFRYNVLDCTPRVQWRDLAGKGLVSVSKPYLRPLKKPTRDASPPLVLALSIRLTADLKPWERTVMPGNCALMGATRPAGIKAKAQTGV